MKITNSTGIHTVYQLVQEGKITEKEFEEWVEHITGDAHHFALGGEQTSWEVGED